MLHSLQTAQQGGEHPFQLAQLSEPHPSSSAVLIFLAGLTDLCSSEAVWPGGRDCLSVFSQVLLFIWS